ncbi:MAG: excisionase family DNA-binding protein [Sporichthyaceae bacterium]|nr:excisionase family DNA-binding protein [Sporichthyaceae bacterium]
MLTTQQAAGLLNVSHPYLIKLLDDGQIDFTKVGHHRQVKLEDLLDYQRRDIASRNRAADDLSALGQQLGV